MYIFFRKVYPIQNYYTCYMVLLAIFIIFARLVL